MTEKLPADKHEREEIFRVLADAKLDSPAAKARALKAFADGLVGEVSRFESYLVVDLAENPDAWRPKAVIDPATAALERQAFEGKGNATARAALVRHVGEDAANSAAVRWNLKGVGDFASKGTAPAVTTDDKGDGKGGDGKDKDTSTNPWRLPSGPEGDAARAAFIKSVGTRAAASLAKSAGKDLAGRPLRAA